MLSRSFVSPIRFQNPRNHTQHRSFHTSRPIRAVEGKSAAVSGESQVRGKKASDHLFRDSSLEPTP